MRARVAATMLRGQGGVGWGNQRAGQAPGTGRFLQAAELPDMARIDPVAAAQMGPTQRAIPASHTLGPHPHPAGAGRQAAGARLVVFPELAFTTFFPRWLLMPTPKTWRRSPSRHAEPGGANPCSTAPANWALASASAMRNAPGSAPVQHRHPGSRPGWARTIGRYRKVHLPGLRRAPARGALPSVGKAILRLWRYSASRPGARRLVGMGACWA